MDFEREIWPRIEILAGETFRQVKGKEFTYTVDSGGVSPDTTNRFLPKSQFRKAWDRMPLSGPGAIQDLQGPSYVFAILTDARVSATALGSSKDRGA